MNVTSPHESRRRWRAARAPARARSWRRRPRRVRVGRPCGRAGPSGRGRAWVGGRGRRGRRGIARPGARRCRRPRPARCLFGWEHSRRDVAALEILDRRSFDDLLVDREARAMAGAVPRGLGRVPGHDAPRCVQARKPRATVLRGLEPPRPACGRRRSPDPRPAQVRQVGVLQQQRRRQPREAPRRSRRHRHRAHLRAQEIRMRRSW